MADLYGSDKATERWDRFYRYLRKHGFHRKAVLEGMSRGGLIVYNWAAKNPDKVACIYADAPVMDITSWPMGKGSSEGSAEDTRRMMEVYGFGSEQEAAEWKGNPLDHAGRIARAGIPVLHVVGDADTVVPVAENTAVFEAEMKRLGAPVKVIHKPGIGHHPHSLNNPEPIVKFILQATGRYGNPCTQAVPGNEFRSAAGWKRAANGIPWNATSRNRCRDGS
ncbi:MAG: alpha/beta hydrolase family protein [Phocaeicola plebeius]|uniref:alpha/beta hydrolase family protein n=1 Tax=Phocaeicola plebeius TaxID=310297 RepID=UPI00399130B9